MCEWAYRMYAFVLCMTCVRVCLCLCVWVQAWMCYGTCVKVRGQPRLLVLAFHLDCKRVSWLFAHVNARLSGPRAPGEAVSCFHLSLLPCASTPSNVASGDISQPQLLLSVTKTHSLQKHKSYGCANKNVEGIVWLENSFLQFSSRSHLYNYQY